MLIIFLLSAVQSCSNIKSGSSSTDTSFTEINVATLKGPSSVGAAKLLGDKPHLSDGTVINYEIASSPDILISKIISGETGIAAIPTNSAAKLFNKGTNIKLAAVVGYGVLYLVYQGMELSDWQNLKTGTVYIPSKGTAPDIVFRYLLEKNGINPDSDLTLNYSIEQVELSQLLISGRAMIAVLPEPFVTMVLKKSTGARIAFDFEEQWKNYNDGSRLPMTCLVANSKFTESGRSQLDEFLNLYKESIDWVKTNPGPASAAIEKLNIGMDAETALAAIPRCNIEYTPASLAWKTVNEYIEVILNFSPEDAGGKLPDESFYCK